MTRIETAEVRIGQPINREGHIYGKHCQSRIHQSTTSTEAAEDRVVQFQPMRCVQVSGVEFEHKPQPYGLGDGITFYYFYFYSVFLDSIYKFTRKAIAFSMTAE
jgi:hypothetical protein